jgi:hypothetical protein
LREGISEPVQLKRLALSMNPFLPSDSVNTGTKPLVTPWETNIREILENRLVPQGERDQRFALESLNRNVLESTFQLIRSISDTVNQWEAKGMEQSVREAITKEWVWIIKESERLNEFRPVFLQKAMGLFLESLSGRLEGPEDSKERILMDVRQWISKWALVKELNTSQHTDRLEKSPQISTSDAEKPQTNSAILHGKKETFSSETVAQAPRTNSSSFSDRISPSESIFERIVSAPTAREDAQPHPPDKEPIQSSNPTGGSDSSFGRERIEPHQFSTMNYLRLMNFSTHTDLATLYTAAFALESFQCRIDWLEKKQYKEGYDTKKTYRIMIDIHTGQLGEVLIDSFFRNHQIELFLYAEPDHQNSLTHHSSTLYQRLRSEGFEVRGIFIRNMPNQDQLLEKRVQMLTGMDGRFTGMG